MTLVIFFKILFNISESKISESSLCEKILFAFSLSDPIFISFKMFIDSNFLFSSLALLILTRDSFPHEFHQLKIHPIYVELN